MPHSIRPGDVLADRYRLVDLLSESGGGRFWRAHDRVLERHVALHVIAADDERAERLLDAARRSATVLDPRHPPGPRRRPDRRALLRRQRVGLRHLARHHARQQRPARRRAAAAWLVSEVADSIAAGARGGVAHGRLLPENVLIDNAGSVRIIGFSVDAALHGLPPGRPAADVADLAGLLYAR